ncbi:MAG: hypothetical protein ACRDK0_06120 [Solirubrobacteraceae bacterium]
MERLSHEREEESVRRAPPPAPEPVQAGSLAWASAIGNQAVQRLARQGAAEELEQEPPQEVEEEPPQEVAAMEAAGIGPREAAGLEAIDDLAEDELPE